ncbi:MAG: type II secretion system F family protein [Planctomycetota bacterium]|nr:type II secretion system F family protein [Planctomycetota bacterium]
MADFRYKTVGLDGASVFGIVQAIDRVGALRLLAQRGICPTELAVASSIRESAPTSRVALHALRSSTNRPTIRRSELSSLIREIATATEAGLPLLQALQTIRKQAKGRALPGILDFVIERVEAGRPLHQAAEDYGQPFDEMVIGMLRAADTTGRMSEVLHQLADLIDRQVELRRDILSATIYPLILAALIVVSIAVLVVFVLPRILAPIIGQVDIELPLPTRVLVATAAFTVNYWWAIVCGMSAVVFGWRRWISRPLNRLALDRLVLRIPVAGPLVRDVAVARFTRTLGTLVSAGIPILQALRVVRDTLGNRAMMMAIDDVQDRVSSGSSLAEPLERSGLFPPLLVQIVNIGEKSGKLEQMLVNAATAFDRQVNSSLKVFTAILPPILIICMAVVASFVLAGMLLPLLQMQEALGA